MTSKTAAIAFKPAPRPQPRTTPQQTRELAEATRELGFGRTTSAPEAVGADVKPGAAPSGRTASASEAMATLKFALPDAEWAGLRLEALKRRVTMKYLVLEALAAKGYDIDISKVAEDGRRNR